MALSRKKRKKLKKFMVGVLVAGLTLACGYSLINGRFAEKEYGRVVAVSALYGDKAVEPHFQRLSYQAAVGKSEITSTTSSENETATQTDAELQLMRDKAALQALKQASLDTTTIGASAEMRKKKYQLNDIQDIPDTVTTTVNVPSTFQGDTTSAAALGLPGAVAPVADQSHYGQYLGRYQLTAYCACVICCDKTDGITASGTHATQGRTIACDRAAMEAYGLKFGDKLIVDGRVYTFEDVGGGIRGNRIDVFFNSHQDALQFGRQNNKDVYVYKE